jgi:hypothetical protein
MVLNGLNTIYYGDNFVNFNKQGGSAIVSTFIAFFTSAQLTFGMSVLVDPPTGKTYTLLQIQLLFTRIA